MQTILYISDNYCTSLDEFKHFLEVGVNDKSIRNEILSYYRDGVLTGWISSFLPTFSCSINEASDNVVYDAIYTQLTGKASVMSSLTSSFSDYVKIEGLRYSKDASNYENLNGTVTTVRSIKVALKVLQPDNNDFVLKAKSNGQTLWEYKLNLKDYKRNQKFELPIDFKEPCTKNVQLLEGDSNVLYEARVCEAVEKAVAMDRFANITKSNFKNVLYNHITKSFAGNCNVEGVIEVVNREIYEKSELDGILKKELVYLLRQWKSLKNSSAQRHEIVALCIIRTTYHLLYLQPEFYFLKGLLYELIGQSPIIYYQLSAKAGYTPAKLKEEQFVAGRISCRDLICGGEKLDSSVMTLGYSTEGNKEKIGKILSFMIRHLFDEYEVQ